MNSSTVSSMGSTSMTSQTSSLAPSLASIVSGGDTISLDDSILAALEKAPRLFGGGASCPEECSGADKGSGSSLIVMIIIIMVVLLLFGMGGAYYYYGDVDLEQPATTSAAPTMLKEEEKKPKVPENVFQNAHKSELPMNFERRPETQVERLARLDASEKRNLKDVVKMGSPLGAKLTKVNIDQRTSEIFPKMKVGKVSQITDFKSIGLNERNTDPVLLQNIARGREEKMNGKYNQQYQDYLKANQMFPNGRYHFDDTQHAEAETGNYETIEDQFARAKKLLI